MNKETVNAMCRKIERLEAQLDKEVDENFGCEYQQITTASQGKCILCVKQSGLS